MRTIDETALIKNTPGLLLTAKMCKKKQQVCTIPRKYIQYIDSYEHLPNLRSQVLPKYLTVFFGSKFF